MTSKTSGRRPVRRWIEVAILVLGLSTLVADGGLRQDEIECEEAVSYLQGCCPDFAGASIACVHDSGCGSTVEPALSIEESQGILSQGCSQIVGSGLCERVKNLRSPGDDAWDTSCLFTVCP
jgi:hypothetical protein